MQAEQRAVTVQTESAEEELRQLALDHLWFHSATAWDDVIEPDGIKILSEGEGCHLKAADGRTFLDATSGLWLANIGYGRREVAEAYYRQASKLQYTRSTNPAEPTVRLAAKLAQITPGSLDHTFFVSGGSEGVETAIKIAKQYHWNRGQAKRYKVIARRQSYHGATLGAMSYSASRLLNKAIFEPLLPGARHVAPPYCYRCDYNLTYPTCNMYCARSIEQVIQFEGPETIAAIIGEPISNSGGVAVPPDEYWPILRQLCDRFGILLIVDETICGFGRTGKMFGIEHWDVVPDVLTCAKGLSSGYAPIGAAIAKHEIFEAFKPGKEQAFQHVITFGGHPAACAAALANIEIMERERLPENAARMGDYIMAGLYELKARHPSIGDVRGKGLLIAVELVKDRETRAGFNPKERQELSKFLTGRCNEYGLLINAGDKISIVPPLTINKTECEEMVSIIDRSLTDLESEWSLWR